MNEAETACTSAYTPLLNEEYEDRNFQQRQVDTHENHVGTHVRDGLRDMVTQLAWQTRNHATSRQDYLRVVECLLSVRRNYSDAEAVVLDIVEARQPDLMHHEKLVKFREYTREQWGNSRARYLNSLRAIWGPNVVTHYNWKARKDLFLQGLHMCTKRWPDFAKFVWPANSVLIKRHESSIIAKDRPSIGFGRRRSDVEDPESPLNNEDVHELRMWAAATNADFEQRERECEEQQPRILEWTQDDDGSILVGDRSLRTWFNSQRQPLSEKMLRFDAYGMLVQDAEKLSLTSAPPTPLSGGALFVSNPGPDGPVSRQPEMEGVLSGALQSVVYRPDRMLSEEDSLEDDTSERPRSVTSESDTSEIAAPLFEGLVNVSLVRMVPLAIRSTKSGPKNPEPPPSGSPHRRWDSNQDSDMSGDRETFERVMEASSLPPELGHDARPNAWASAREASEFVERITLPAFLQLAGEDKPFTKVYVIEQVFVDAGSYSLPEYLSLVKDYFPGQTVDVNTSDLPEESSAHEAGQRALNGRNVLNLRPVAKAERPQIVRLNRFRLLDKLVERTRQNWDPGTGAGMRCRSDSHYIAGSLELDILEFAQRHSESDVIHFLHVDCFAGSCVRCLFGEQDWIVVDPRRMKEQDWMEFEEQGNGWQPGSKATRICLKADDVLLIPPGLRVIHSVRTQATALMERGVLWDEKNILQVLVTRPRPTVLHPRTMQFKYCRV